MPPAMRCRLPQTRHPAGMTTGIWAVVFGLHILFGTWVLGWPDARALVVGGRNAAPI